MIRWMEPGDLFAVVRLEELSFSEPWSRCILTEVLENNLDTCFVLEEGGDICGYAVLRLIGDEGEVQRIAVTPALRGLGYGKKLMETMVNFAREQAAGSISLEVRSGNETARNLYRVYGFKEEAVRRDYYRNPVEDAIIMWNREI